VQPITQGTHAPRAPLLVSNRPSLVLTVLLGFFDASKGVVSGEMIGVHLNWGLGQRLLLPLVWAEVAAGLGDSLEGSLGKVSERGRATLGTGVNVLITGKGQDLLRHGGGNNTGTSRGRDESHVHGATFGVDLAGDGVRVSEFGAPVASSDGNDGELGEDDGGADCVGHLFGALDAEADVTGGIADDNGGLESSSLTSSGLLLDRLDLEDFVLKCGTEKMLDDFGFLDREREGVNLA